MNGRRQPATRDCGPLAVCTAPKHDTAAPCDEIPPAGCSLRLVMELVQGIKIADYCTRTIFPPATGYAMFATPIAYLIHETGTIAHDVAVRADAIQELIARQRVTIPN